MSRNYCILGNLAFSYFVVRGKSCRSEFFVLPYDLKEDRCIHDIIMNIILLFYYIKQRESRRGLMLLWFKDLVNVTEEVIIHKPNISTLL